MDDQSPSPEEDSPVNMTKEITPPPLEDEETQDFEEPQQQPSDGEWLNKPPHIVTHEVLVDEEGRFWLAVRSVESRRVGRRLRRRQYRVIEKLVRLEESSRVEKELASKITNFKPAEDETTIHCLMRLSWWSHGPRQIGLILAGIIGTALLVTAWVTVINDTTISIGWVMLGLVLFWLMIGGYYFTVWMKWAYRYLIITDRRIGLAYSPPFSLPGTENFASLANIRTTEAKDQNWAANLLGRINPAYRFGILANDTAAQEDKWMQAIKFVREHTTVAETILRLSLGSEAPQETEEMRTSRELQDLANKRFLEIHGDPMS